MVIFILIQYILLNMVAAKNVPEYVAVFNAASGKSSSSGSAKFDCILTNLWTENRHPNDYPSDAHWSQPVIVSHDLGYSMFKEGETSTEGLKIVAETGATTKLVNEINSYGDSILTTKVGKGMDGISLTAKQKLTKIILDDSHPYLSMVTMVAPSPDWITGINDFDMRTEDESKIMNWRQEVILDLFPWDAGTDSGTTYNSPNKKSSGGKVTQLTINTIPQDSKVFESPEKVTVLPVARLQCLLDGKSAVGKKKCKRKSNIAKECKKSRQCCPGLACIRKGKGKGKKSCLPLGHEGQKCKKTKDCITGLMCTNKQCSD